MRSPRTFQEVRMEVSTQARQVVEGLVAYDDVPPAVQVVVRAAWVESLKELCAELDLAVEFRTIGRPWSELDEFGQVVIRH